MTDQEQWESVWGKLDIAWDDIPAELERIAAANGAKLEWIDHPPAEEVGQGELCGRMLYYMAPDGWTMARRTPAGLLRGLRMAGRAKR